MDATKSADFFKVKEEKQRGNEELLIFVAYFCFFGGFVHLRSGGGGNPKEVCALRYI